MDVGIALLSLMHVIYNNNLKLINILKVEGTVESVTCRTLNLEWNLMIAN